MAFTHSRDLAVLESLACSKAGGRRRHRFGIVVVLHSGESSVMPLQAAEPVPRSPIPRQGRAPYSVLARPTRICSPLKSSALI